jgi:subtilisin family serine protease
LHDLIFVPAEEQGILVVAPAANDATDIDKRPYYPASLGTPNMITVLAIDQEEKCASYSNFGARTVDIGAPGGAGLEGVPDILSTLPGNQYGSRAGTLPAAAHVAGATALVWAQFREKKPAEIKDSIMEHARPVEALRSFCRSGRTLDLGFLARPPG